LGWRFSVPSVTFQTGQLVGIVPLAGSGAMSRVCSPMYAETMASAFVSACAIRVHKDRQQTPVWLAPQAAWPDHIAGDRFDGILGGDIVGLFPLGWRQVEDGFQDGIQERGQAVGGGRFQRGDFPPQPVAQMARQRVERFREGSRQTRRGNQAPAMSQLGPP
jgi:hypothetical protein